MWAYDVTILFVLPPSFQHLKQLTDFHETWYVHYATGGHPKLYFCNR
jgi:hypothetical protein